MWWRWCEGGRLGNVWSGARYFFVCGVLLRGGGVCENQ